MPQAALPRHQAAVIPANTAAEVTGLGSSLPPGRHQSVRRVAGGFGELVQQVLGGVLSGCGLLAGGGGGLTMLPHRGENRHGTPVFRDP